MDHLLLVEVREWQRLQKLYLLLLVGSSVKSVCSENSSIDRVKTVTRERCDTHVALFCKKCYLKNKLV